jgi:glycosyltransferase involved in cell wall biosynthesis
MVPANFWGCLLAKLLRNRLTVYTCHEPFLQKGLAMRFQQTALNMFLTNRVISISDMTTRFVSEVCHASPNKIVKMPNAVDTDRFNPDVSGSSVRKAIGIPEDVPVIGNVGRYAPEKGYSFFLEAAALIRQMYPEARFLIVGHVPEHNYLRNLTKKLGLQDRVIFAGPRRDIPEVMGAIDIFLFTSIWGEGFGVSLIEAMASGRPIIAANVGATREIIADRVTGLLPSPKVWMPETDHLDAAALAEAADFLLRNPDVRQQLGQEARRQAVKRFSMPSWIKSTEDLYRDMLKDRN